MSDEGINESVTARGEGASGRSPQAGEGPIAMTNRDGISDNDNGQDGYEAFIEAKVCEAPVRGFALATPLAPSLFAHQRGIAAWRRGRR